jgi:hypothetical protein
MNNWSRISKEHEAERLRNVLVQIEFSQPPAIAGTGGKA